MVIRYLKQTRKVKKLGKSVPYELTKKKKKKIIVLKCLLLFYTTTMNHFSIRLWCATKSGFYMTAGDTVGLWISYKALLNATLAPKTGYGHCLVVCCLSDPLYLSESKRNHYIWEVCSANQWDAPKTAMTAADIGQQKGPILHHDKCLTAHHTTSISKVEQSVQWRFASSAIFTWPLTNGLPLLQASWQLFARKTLP